MQVRTFIGKAVAIGLATAAAALLAPGTADARSHGHGGHGGSGHGGRFAGHYASYRHGGLQCVPFARENTGIELAGNAATWWSNAAGVYERGARPEVGSVLNFRANGRMHMGHVAVVSNVVNSRNIEIDHANWAGPGGSPGGVSRNITVVDVSPTNDWSAVRVALGHSGEFGSIYPTFGFIYDRPDKGMMVANSGNAPAPLLNAPPRDLRPAVERVDAGDSEEVAEASDDMPRYRTRHAGRHGTTRLSARSTERFAERTRGHDRFATHDRLVSTERFAPRGRDRSVPAILRADTRTAHTHTARHRT